jgi:hypothetical protein
MAGIHRPHLVALVRAGVVFEKRVMTERSEEQDTELAAKISQVLSTGLDDSSGLGPAGPPHGVSALE